MVVVNVHNHVVGIITRKDLMPFRMQERLEALLEQNTTLATESENALNGEVPTVTNDSVDSGKASSLGNKPPARPRSPGVVSKHSTDVGHHQTLSRAWSTGTNKVTLNEKDDDDDDDVGDARSLQSSIHSSTPSVVSEVSDNEAEEENVDAAAAVLSQIVVNISPPSDDTPDSEAP